MSPRALLSVSDKRGLVPFAKSLRELGWELLSTGGTARVLSEAGLDVTPVDKVTGFPDIMGGRVKTLHPRIHGALLARPDHPGDADELAEHGIEPIDLVTVNLYPFRSTIARPDVSMAEATEQIDIGGPTMLRAAAKNHERVVVIVDPQDYPRVIEALRNGGSSLDLRRELAAKVFAHTAAYDAAIAEFVSRRDGDWPQTLTLVLEHGQSLRYGENPNQSAAMYYTDEPRGLRHMVQLHGKALSFNNLLDIDAAVMSVAPWERRPACGIIKHTTPCGIAVAASSESSARN